MKLRDPVVHEGVSLASAAQAVAKAEALGAALQTRSGTKLSARLTTGLLADIRSAGTKIRHR